MTAQRFFYWSRPRSRIAHALCRLALAIGMAAALPAAAGDDDHDRARQAVIEGEVLPLDDVLARLARTHPGQVLETELERDDGRWIYEIKLLQPDGQLLRLDLDARTGAVLRQKHKRAAPDGSGASR